MIHRDNVEPHDDTGAPELQFTELRAGSESHGNREARLRRVADRHGLILTKSRTRNQNAPDYGRYVIVDKSSNTVVAGAGPTGLPSFDLDDVEQSFDAVLGPEDE